MNAEDLKEKIGKLYSYTEKGIVRLRKLWGVEDDSKDGEAALIISWILSRLLRLAGFSFPEIEIKVGDEYEEVDVVVDENRED